jgi:glycosyltransferase involved in cell wall biosynthesis
MCRVNPNGDSARHPGSGHVALNAHLLSSEAGYRNAGVSQYIHALLRTLPAADTGLQLTAYVGAGVTDSFPGWQMRRSRLPGSRPLLRIPWEQGLQPLALRRAGVDLLHAPVNIGPLVRPCRLVVTVHDLSFVLYPETFPPMQRLYQRTMARWTARHADRIVAVSESTRADLVRYFHVPAERVTVVPNGVDPAFRPLPPAEIDAFRRRRGLPERFLLSVGTVQPRKNIPRLLEALARVPGAPPLVLCGGRGWYYDAIYATIERLELADRVHLAGFVPQAELPLWYNAATCFVCPSLYEGFGFPVLEALACGTPAIVSRASSLPEVAGDAAILVDPQDVEGLAVALARVLQQPDVAASLRAAGPRQAARFPWPRTAEATAAIYRNVLAGGLSRA